MTNDQIKETQIVVYNYFPTVYSFDYQEHKIIISYIKENCLSYFFSVDKEYNNIKNFLICIFKQPMDVEELFNKSDKNPLQLFDIEMYYTKDEVCVVFCEGYMNGVQFASNLENNKEPTIEDIEELFTYNNYDKKELFRVLNVYVIKDLIPIIHAYFQPYFLVL